MATTNFQNFQGEHAPDPLEGSCFCPVVPPSFLRIAMTLVSHNLLYNASGTVGNENVRFVRVHYLTGIKYCNILPEIEIEEYGRS